MEDPTAFGGNGGCRTTAAAAPAVGDMGVVLATIPARRVSLERLKSYSSKWLKFFYAPTDEERQAQSTDRSLKIGKDIQTG